MANKAETISRVYYAPEGFGSITETVKAAQKYDPTISYKDVREWKANQEENQRKKAKRIQFIHCRRATRRVSNGFNVSQ